MRTMLKHAIIFAFLAVCAAVSQASSGDIPSTEYRIRSGTFGNWIVIGESIKFKSDDKLPLGIKIIIASVNDSSGKKALETEIDAETFVRDGWNWKPSQVGFYAVKFKLRDTSGIISDVVDQQKYDCHDTAGKFVGSTLLRFSEHSVAVLSSPTRKPKDIPALFGISMGNSVKGLDAAALVGFNFVRTDLSWRKAVPAENCYDWTSTDTLFRHGHELGFELVLIVSQTPKWIARDSSEEIGFVVQKYTGSAPKDLKPWKDFLREAVKHYPEINCWELWNEPNLPGLSCAWDGSPEDYLELLKTGYETVKAGHPDSTVWLGGLGMNYLPFYEKIMALGAYNYYDVLPLHGQWSNPAPFDAVVKCAGLTPKRWVMGENHGILASAGEDPIPSEQALARNLLLEFLNCIRLKGDGVAIHTINSTGSRERLAFSRKCGNMWNHISGFFADDIYWQPRLAALVMRNFADCLSGKVNYLEGYSFANGTQCASLVESDAGKVLFIWQSGTIPAKADPVLLKADGKSSTLLEWEARSLDTASFEILPDHVYFLKNPDMAVIDSWSGREQVVHPVRAKILLDKSVNGLYRPSPLFDADFKTLMPETLPWNEAANYVGCDFDKSKNLLVKKRPDGFSASFAAGFNVDCMDLLVRVKDSIHFQNSDAKALWDGDSIQFAIDSGSNGIPNERLEFTAALGPKGAVLWKQHLPPIMGDMPLKITFADCAVKYGRIKVEKTVDDLLYKIHVDREDLYPFVFNPRKPVRFSLLVNDNDGAGRLGWLEWASGIGASKEPALYGNLTVAVKGDVFKQSDLKGSWGGVNLSFGDGSVKVEALESDKAATVSTSDAPFVPGAKYRMTFKAKGDVTLQGMLVVNPHKQKGRSRLDILERIPLKPGDWSQVEASFVAPEEIECASLALFCWCQKGFFEIRDFKVTAGN